MSALNTVPLLGKHLTTYSLVPQTVASNGTFTPATAINLLAKSDGLEVTESPEHEEINAMNTTRRNMVIISDGAEVVLNIYKVNDGTDPNPLWTAINSYDYFQLNWVEGTATGSIQTCSCWGVRGPFSTSMRGRGKQIAEMHLLPIDIGSAQMTRTIS